MKMILPVVLSLQEVEFFFDPFTCLGHSELEWLSGLRWALMGRSSCYFQTIFQKPKSLRDVLNCTW